jgi:hypothetical protein
LFGGGDWISTRPAEVEPGTLHELNRSAAAPLGQHWDADFISMEISPGCIPLLNDFWEVGGRASRPSKSDFPQGLELTCTPFTLRLASIHHSAMSSEHENELREAGERLRQFLEASGVTGHPVLSPPSSKQSKALQLAKKERLCSGEQLAVALSQCCPSQDWQLFLCRYGFKVEAKPFLKRFAACKTPCSENWEKLGLGLLGTKKTWTWAPSLF